MYVSNILKKIEKAGKNSKCFRLAMNMKPVPTIIDSKEVINKISEISNVTSPVSILRRSPK